MTGTNWLRNTVMLLGFGLSPFAFAAADASILEMSSISTLAYGQASQSVHVKVLVPNNCYEKNVTVLFQKEDGSPSRVVARYVGPADAGNEIWEAYANLGPGNFKAQVDYTEADDSASDRSSLLLRQGSGPVLYGERSVMAVYNPQVMNRGSVHFHAAVKNFAYGKRVRVHYSHDGWKSSEAADLSYQRVFNYGRGSVVMPNDEGFEVWSGAPEIGGEVDELSYYFTYEVAGQTFIDNNFGHNYTVQLR
ncbi:MAG TPA: hypothetical protein VFO10_25840 [Oligoflexus sp.]|uniref:hypothetical protein n=1 Tax=Oligoflexus sp. TaxID=1971216 RepID=UPI002D7F9659|nr:hypothetical protein [Oligoflexus sp.]HET9240712.1 hypothetical protein [Oligoflexus sp.]